jgi:competence ComEA-like helix-hairpin-helix protein
VVAGFAVVPTTVEWFCRINRLHLSWGEVAGGERKQITFHLRDRDQTVVAAVTLVLWAFVAGYWLLKGGADGGLVNIERSAVRPVRFTIDINQADWPEFALLPGIGPSKARGIIDLRERLGRFHDHDDLLKVRGIGPKTMAAMRPYLLPLESDRASDLVTSEPAFSSSPAAEVK